MSPLALAFAYLRHRPLRTAMTLALLALGVGTMTLLALLTEQLSTRLSADADGIDMVVGAKGSPMQLILAAIYQIEPPTGHITEADAATVAAHPMVRQVIPMALGDTYRGFRVVGTDEAYLDLRQPAFAEGRAWQAPLEVVLGAAVAARSGLAVGDTLVAAHGLEENADEHEDKHEDHVSHEEHPFIVVGVLAATGTVTDRLILTGVDSVRLIHETPIEAGGGHEHDHDDDTGEPAEAERDDSRWLSALLVRFSNPMGAAVLPRLINMTTPMQAALPAYEIARLLRLIGAGIDGFRAFAVVLVIAAGLSILSALYGALTERRYDIAVMRSLGAARGRVTSQLLLEGILLGVAGGVLGVLLGHAVAEIGGMWLWFRYQVAFTGLAWSPQEAWLLAGTLGLSVLAALLPAVMAHRLEISPVLARH